VDFGKLFCWLKCIEIISVDTKVFSKPGKDLTFTMRQDNIDTESQRQWMNEIKPEKIYVRNSFLGGVDTL